MTDVENQTTRAKERPVGRTAVVDALIDATVELVVAEGMHVSVREIAKLAGVNHGLVHTYFDSKQQLMSRAFDRINQRASAHADADGFPPPDLASRRDGELAKAIARIGLESESDSDPFTSHPIVAMWREALIKTRPELDDDEIAAMVTSASALGLGWAMYGDYLCQLLAVTPEKQASLGREVMRLVAELGGIPDPDVPPDSSR